MENEFEESVMDMDIIIFIQYSFMCFYFTLNNYIFIIYLCNWKTYIYIYKVEPKEAHCMPMSLH